MFATSSLGIGGSGTVSSGTQGQFAFYNANGTTLTATSTLFVSQAGYIGIGTTSPFTTLAVNGSGYFTGNLTAPIVDNGGQVVNVKAFGAKGDGVSDDAAAINSAMMAGAGRAIYFPPGTYLVSTSIHVPSNTALYGAGQNSIITCPSGGWNMSTTSIFGILNLYHTSDIDIHDLHITGTKTADQGHTPKLIYLEAATNISIHDNTLDNSAWEGIWEGGDPTQTMYISVTNNRIDNVGYPNSYVGLPAIQMGAIHAVISGNLLTNVGTGIGASGQQTIVSNNTIINPQVVGIGTGDGMRPLGMVIEGNRIELTPSSSNTVTGINLGDGSGGATDQIIVSDNHIRTTQAPGAYETRGIWATNAPEASISDNVVEFVGKGVGIQVDGTSAGSAYNVENNTIRVIGETSMSFGINGTPGGVSNSLTITTSGNRVYGMTRTNNSFAFDFNSMGGGSLNVTIAGDQADGGLYRYLSEYVNDGSLDNRPIYRSSALNDASFDTLAVASSSGFAIGTNNLLVSNGNVGIGTSTPGSLLSINNIANFTAGTSTFYSAGGLNLANGCFSVGGNCLPSTPNYWSLANGNLYNNTGNSVGIGTNAPSYKLDVRGAYGAIAAFYGDNGYTGVTISTSTNNYTDLQVADAGGLAMNVVSNPNDLATSDAYLAAIASGLGLGVSLSTPVNADNNYISLRARGDVAVFTNSGSTALNERMRVTAGGNVGIGTTSPDMLLTVGSNSPSGSVAHFENSTGSCYINPTTTSLSCSSDSRLKTNVVPLDSADGLAAVLKLNPVTYNWKTEAATTSPHTGFIAQDVQPILPDLVSQGPDGYYTLNYAGLTPYLVKAVQEIATLSGTFKTNLIAWLGSAAERHHRLLCAHWSLRRGTPTTDTKNSAPPAPTAPQSASPTPN